MTASATVTAVLKTVDYLTESSAAGDRACLSHGQAPMGTRKSEQVGFSAESTGDPMPATSIEPSAKHLRELSVDEASLVSSGSALKAALAWAGAFVSSSGAGS